VSWLLITCFVVQVLSAGSAELYLNDDKRELAIGVQHAIYDDDFVLADSLGCLLGELFPDDPMGPFSRAASLLGKMFDREEPIESERFFDLLEIADSLASQIIDTASPGPAAWMAFYRGHVRSYRALWEARFGSSIRAIRLGYAARSEYERGLEYDSSCYDLYLGLGLYHYWKSAKGGILRRLRILKNEMDRGIAELRLAANSSAISREAARNSLIWVWLDRRQYDSAIVLCQEMSATFPDGKLFLWPLAEAYYRSKNYQRAAEVYQQLRDKLASDPGNCYNLIECDYQLYQCYDELGLDDEARSVARRACEYFDEMPKETRRRQRSRIASLGRAARR
jgi:tetratricopeptide (TPR) repeat protein